MASWGTIAEISDPDRPGARDSERVAALWAVRKEYVDLFGQPPKGKFEEVGGTPVVILIGIGFFGAIHNQKGVAPNGIELHPLLDIEQLPWNDSSRPGTVRRDSGSATLTISSEGDTSSSL